MLLHAIVHSAGIQDRDGGILLLATMKGLFPFLEKLFADSAYQGPIFADGIAKILPRLKTEIIERSDQAKGFVKLPRRWIVERTIAWLNRCRRLAKDWENLNRNALYGGRWPLGDDEACPRRPQLSSEAAFTDPFRATRRLM